MWKNSNSQTFRSYAKVNLYLEITGTRPDGFHELITDFHTIDLHDIISISPARTTALQCDHADVPTDQRNLALKALSLLEGEIGSALPLKIHIEKNIPVAGGLGGGSSNAATILSGVNSMLKEQLPIETLHRLATEIGSDVPFFLYGGYMRGRGRGELLEQLPDIEPLELMLLIPDFGVSAAEAYRQYDKLEQESGDKAVPGSILLRNDLEEAVFQHYPAIMRMRQKLIAEYNCEIMMSGSGSTLIANLTNSQIAVKMDGRSGDDNIIIIKTNTLNRAAVAMI
jgi:4-diphosphocytidyl-2-C-methyl-D-erythritol kinase